MELFNIKNTLGALLLSLAAMAPLSVYGIKANPRAVSITQPDGKVITVKIHGDENHHYVATTDGFRIAKDTDGFYKYLTLNATKDRFVLSSQRVAEVGERNTVETAFVRALGEPNARRQQFERTTTFKQPAMTLSPSVINPSANGGLARAKSPARANAEANESQYLVVLVNFANCRMRFHNEDFDNFLNQKNYDGFGSVKDYFRDNSNRKFVPNFTTLGPYTLSQPQSYYADNDYDTGSDQNPRAMVAEAVKLAKENNPEIDFSQFDNDGDGYMDNVYVIYAGYSEASTGNEADMWPHSWTMGDDTFEVDGITVKNYSCSQELVGAPGAPVNPSMDGIGTFTHEFGHVLGLRDMYDTNDYYDGFGIDPGAYSLYASGSYNNESRTPAALWAFERLQMGWMEIGTDVKELKDGEDVMQENSATSFTARYINCQPNRPVSKGYEWFIVENRQLTGWDAYIPNHGMLIYHYDWTEEKQENWKSNGPNNDARHRCLYIKCADGIDDDNTRSGDTYPGTTANTSFTDTTKPNARNWAGAKTNVPLTNIREADGKIYYQAAGGSSTWNVIVTEPASALHDKDVTLNSTVRNALGTISEMGFCWTEGRTNPTINDSHATVTVADEASLKIENLKEGTEYSYRAYMKMSDATIVYGSPMEFTTEYLTAYAPFNQDFTSWKTGKLEGWQVVDNNGDGTTWVYDKNSGSACYQFDYWNNADDWLISKRRYHIPENGAIFFERGVTEENYIETLEIFVSTKSSNINDFYLHKRFSIADNFGRKVWEEVDLSQYAGQDIYIAFRCTSARSQGLLRIWDLRLAPKLGTPEVTYFGKGDNDDQIKVTWSEVPGAEKYWLFFGKVTEQTFKQTMFCPIDYFANYTQNIEMGTGHVFFMGTGSVEVKEIPSGYEDLRFMIYPTGPVGTSYLDVEGTTDGKNWTPVCPRVIVDKYNTDGIECNFSSYVAGCGYTKFRFKYTDNGRLCHMRYLTLSYYDGYEWEQLANGTVTGTEQVINAKTPGEFNSGKYVCWVAAGDSEGIYFDESPEKFYTVAGNARPSVTGIESIKAGAEKRGYTYNIAGQRVAVPTKGLYINNGKKMLIGK